MTFTLPTRHISNTDAEMHRQYARMELSLMRIAKLNDCRVREVREALQRQQRRMTARSGGGHAMRRRAPVTLPRVSGMEQADG